MTAERVHRLQSALEIRLSPIELRITDQSHLHAGHAGASDGRGHFDIRIISAVFRGKSRIHRHRMVYDAVHDLMQSDIHALRITALAPGET